MEYGTLGALVATLALSAGAALWCCATGVSSVAVPVDASLDQGVIPIEEEGVVEDDDAGQIDDQLTPDVCGSTVTASPDCKVPDAGASCEGGWCNITPGCFIMGSPPCQYGRGAYDERQIQVTLTHQFVMGQHEVTQAEWVAVGYKNPSKTLDAGDAAVGDCPEPTCPVGNVTWYEALAYTNKLSELNGLPACYNLMDCAGEIGEGVVCHDVQTTTATLYECRGYRLPMEAEWEYAARAGTTSAFYNGLDVTEQPSLSCFEDPSMDKIGWYCINSKNLTHPVEQKAVNPWGLFDMSGNVMEWLNDEFDGLGYGDGPVVDPRGSLTGVAYSDGGMPELRSLRSGHFYAPANIATSSHRWEIIPTLRSPGFGFRVARTIGGFADAGSH